MSKVIKVNPSLLKAAEILSEALGEMGLKDFPYESRLSMKPLVSKWMSEMQGREDRLNVLYEQIKIYVDQYPSILDPYPDVVSLVHDHHSIVHLLLSSIFPLALSQGTYGYAAAPFMMEPFYITSGLQNLLADTRVQLQYEQFSEFDKISYSVRAGLIILEKYYNISLDHALPFLFSLKYEGTNMERFYKSTSMLDFLVVKVRSEPPVISKTDLDKLLRNLNNSQLWLEVFSPEVFYFEGFYLAFMNDVTEVETLSRLRKLLLTSDSFLDYNTAKMVANLTRVYLSMLDVEVGIFAVDYPFEKSKAYRYNINYPIINIGPDLQYISLEHTIYEKACRENKIQIIANFEQVEGQSGIELNLTGRGFKSLMVVPLRDHQKKVIGIMELASPTPYVFTHVKRLKLKEILPLYDVAVEDTRNAIDNRIQTVIQEQFTNIHPSVKWKFSETAYRYLSSLQSGEEPRQIEAVQFNDVYPIFGQVDIISSTLLRNSAVKTDLSKNLYLVADALNDSYAHTKFQLLKKLSFEVDNISNNMSADFDINQETIANNLLVNEIHPVLKEIRSQHPTLETTISSYFSALDPRLEIIYEARRDYEFSLNKINQTISRHLEQEENKNQIIIPHYFEKFKTDGIEYTIYVGQSMLAQGRFYVHHLQNLRLWQLYSMVEIYRQLEVVRNDLPIDMNVSFLILVFNLPINISFRMEEKRFDVDSSYHARYEILKKRMDKAKLAGLGERLTQKDKLAIVYLNDQERREYLEYLQFLVDEKLLEPEIEDLSVEKEQDVQGVKALRVKFRK